LRIVLQLQLPQTTAKRALKTLVVDNDRAMLRNCVARIGGRQPLTVVTSKEQAMDLLRLGRQYEVVVACERLADGSGLALLDEVQAKWPQVIRVFCSERSRLAMVRSRLSAFRLRYTLSYPIKPVRLELMLLHLAHLRNASSVRLRVLPS
jgi:DNA-binding NtrC family response regulator